MGGLLAVRKVLDDDDFFPVMADHAKNIIVGFGRMEGAWNSPPPRPSPPRRSTLPAAHGERQQCRTAGLSDNKDSAAEPPKGGGGF